LSGIPDDSGSHRSACSASGVRVAGADRVCSFSNSDSSICLTGIGEFLIKIQMLIDRVLSCLNLTLTWYESNWRSNW